MVAVDALEIIASPAPRRHTIGQAVRRESLPLVHGVRGDGAGHANG